MKYLPFHFCAHLTNSASVFVQNENNVIKSLKFNYFILQNVFFLYIFCSYFMYILNSVVQEKIIFTLCCLICCLKRTAWIFEVVLFDFTDISDVITHFPSQEKAHGTITYKFHVLLFVISLFITCY